MMSSACPASAVRARASCGLPCANSEQILHDGAARRAVVAEQRFCGAAMQFFDSRKTRQAECFARDDDDQRQCSQHGEPKSEKAKTFAARE